MIEESEKSLAESKALGDKLRAKFSKAQMQIIDQNFSAVSDASINIIAFLFRFLSSLELLDEFIKTLTNEQQNHIQVYFKVLNMEKQNMGGDTYKF